MTTSRKYASSKSQENYRTGPSSAAGLSVIGYVAFRAVSATSGGSGDRGLANGREQIIAMERRIIGRSQGTVACLMYTRSNDSVTGNNRLTYCSTTESLASDASPWV